MKYIQSLIDWWCEKDILDKAVIIALVLIVASILLPMAALASDQTAYLTEKEAVESHPCVYLDMDTGLWMVSE